MRRPASKIVGLLERGEAGSLPQIITFGGTTPNPLPIPEDMRADVWYNEDANGSSQVATINLRNGQPLGIMLSPGQTLSLPGSAVASFGLTTASVWFYVAIVPPDFPFVWTRTTGTFFNGAFHLDEAGQFAASLAAATGQTTERAGVNTLNVGESISYRFSCEGQIATAADTAVYAALVGHADSKAYVMAVAGTAQAGKYRNPNLQKYDIVMQNQDTVAHYAMAAFEGWQNDD